MLTKRQKSILQYMLDRRKPAFGEEIASSVGITTRTLRTEMRAIDSHLERYGITVHSSPRAGYWLNEEERAVLVPLTGKSDLPNKTPAVSEEREIYLYFRLLTAEDYLTMDTLANELYTSKTTISKDIHSMLTLVDAVGGISLELSRKKGIRLHGEEQYIRKLISGILQYYQMQYMDFLHKTINRQYLQHGMLDKLYYILVDSMLEQNLIVAGPSMELLAMEYFLIFQRKQRGHELIVNLDLKYKEISLPIAEMEELFGVTITEKDRISMLQLLQIKRFLHSPIIQETQSQQMQEIGKRFFDTVLEQYSFDFRNNETLLRHIYAMLTYHHLTFRKRGMLVGEIQQNYPFAYEVARCIIPIAEEILGYHLQENEISRFAVRLVVAMDEIPNRKRTLVVVDSASYSELLRLKLKQYFSHKIEFAGTCPAYQLDKLLTTTDKPIDLILATTSLMKTPKIDMLRISPILNQQDINLLNDYFFRNNRSYRKNNHIANNE